MSYTLESLGIDRDTIMRHATVIPPPPKVTRPRAPKGYSVTKLRTEARRKQMLNVKTGKPLKRRPGSKTWEERKAQQRECMKRLREKFTVQGLTTHGKVRQVGVFTQTL